MKQLPNSLWQILSVTTYVAYGALSLLRKRLTRLQVTLPISRIPSPFHYRALKISCWKIIEDSAPQRHPCVMCMMLQDYHQSHKTLLLLIHHQSFLFVNFSHVPTLPYPKSMIWVKCLSVFKSLPTFLTQRKFSWYFMIHEWSLREKCTLP